MLPLFKTFLFGRFPSYFKREDTYKDVNDKGLLERFLENFGDELDDEVTSDIENYLDIVDPLIAPEKFINLIAYTLGNPPDVFNNVTQYRSILSNIMAIYKVKGTLASYEVFFTMLGYDLLVITELPEVNTYYDTGELYDDTEFYDLYCLGCSDYTIAFGTTTNAPINQTTLDILQTGIPFIEPINANLVGLIFGLIFEDIADYCILENQTLTNTNLLLYDNSKLYDDSNIYDYSTVGQITNLANDCTGSNMGVGYWELTEYIVQ